MVAAPETLTGLGSRVRTSRTAVFRRAPQVVAGSQHLPYGTKQTDISVPDTSPATAVVLTHDRGVIDVAAPIAVPDGGLWIRNVAGLIAGDAACPVESYDAAPHVPLLIDAGVDVQITGKRILATADPSGACPNPRSTSPIPTKP